MISWGIIGLGSMANRFAISINEVENAKSKLKRKNLDLIVLNSLQDKGAGFKSDTNKVTLIDKDENISTFKLKSKTEVATDIINTIITAINA